MSLKEYTKKRDFNSTTEPTALLKKSKKNRFVIQYHIARAKHYDFRLEYNGVLLSWAVPKGLSLNPKDKRLAVHVEDHPVDYINFEGIIPKGNYGAGTVEIFDSGNYLPLENFKAGFKKGQLKFVLNGSKFKGGFSLVKTDEKNWLIIKLNDEFVSTKQTKENTKLPFKTCAPQLATLTNKIPTSKDWLFEIKYDGYRILSYLENKKVKLVSRNNVDFTEKFSEIAKNIAKLQQNSLVFDGEVVIFDKFGKSDFSLLQKSIKEKNNDFCYVIFDLLALNGEDLRSLPLIERKKKLELVLNKADKKLMFSSHLIDKGNECFAFAKEKNLEGIIAKNINSTYKGERNLDWLKIKCYMRQEFIICGYTKTNKNEILSALILGYFENNNLIYVGKVGTGFSETEKEELVKKFKKHISKTCPLTNNIKEKNVVWLVPKLVAEIQFAEFTKDNLLRQPSFVGLRLDKNAKDVKLEKNYEK